MATAKPNDVGRKGPLGHPWRNALVVVVVVAALGVALVWHHLQAQAVLAVAYGARIGCSCHYIGGRGLANCRKDFEPGMELVMLSDDGAAHAITARIPLMASETAHFREGVGCVLPAWGA